MNWKAVAGSAAQGAITGTVAGFTGGASLLVTATAAGAANAVGGAVNNAVQGKQITMKSVVIDATTGAAFGAFGKVLQSQFAKSITGSIAKKLLPCGCFTDTALILTNKGYKPIKNISVGDSVLSFNPKTSKTEFNPVLSLLNITRDTLYQIHLSNQTVQVTADHPFYVGKSWRQARDLKIGDRLTLLDNKSSTIQKVDFKVGLFNVYNFEVKDNHSYFVSISSILVHNGACDVLKSSGFYKIIKSGEEIYIGKGNQIARAGTSLAAKEGEQASFFQVTQGVAGQSVEKTAFIYEYLGMQRAEDAGIVLKNKIASPGKELFKKLGESAQKAFNKAYDEVLKVGGETLTPKK